MSAPGTRPYHHGDLRRALILAARELLEAGGIDALSLRAVAREAGVSPAAPYHHFKDKGELLAAVADQGFEDLGAELRRTRDATAPGAERLAAVGAAYAAFAVQRRALYRVMSNVARTHERLPDTATAQIEVVHILRDTVRQTAAPGASEAEVQLAAVAAWAAIHGLVDLATFRALEPLKAQAGGEEAFLQDVMRHLGVFAGR